MKWTTKNVTLWHRWFAWYPVVTYRYNLLGGNTYSWLCYVERRLLQQTSGVNSYYRSLS